MPISRNEFYFDFGTVLQNRGIFFEPDHVKISFLTKIAIWSFFFWTAVLLILWKFDTSGGHFRPEMRYFQYPESIFWKILVQLHEI